VATRPRIGVVGHVEWVLFGRAAGPPSRGQIVHLHDPFETPAGGGAVAALALARAGAEVIFWTALAEDHEGIETRRLLSGEGIDVRAGSRDGRQARAVVVLDDAGERTITVAAQNHYPRGDESLGWDDASSCAAIYATCAEPSALVAARRAPILVASARQADAVRAAGIVVDVLLGSARDAGERPGEQALDPPPSAVVETLGEKGGRWSTGAGVTGTWAATPAPDPTSDAYGAGDCFAAGLTYGLGVGEGLPAAIERGAAWGAEALGRRGC
jgi:ribokinase